MRYRFAPWRAAAVAVLSLTNAGVPAADDGGDLLERPAELVAAVRSRFGNELRVLRVSLRREDADLDVQDPAVPSHIDRYTYAEGALGPPEPVQAGRNQKRLNAQIFAFAEVDLSILPRLLADARTRAETEEARATHVLIEREDRGGEYEGWGRPLIRIYVAGPRGGALVEYGLDGKHRRVNRW